MPPTPPRLDRAAADDTAIERLLLDYTRRVARYPGGRRAVVIHLSQLRPDNRRGHHIRIAVNTFESLVKQFDGQIFLLDNADIVFVCKNASIAAIDEAITRLRYLFGEDPLAAELDETAPDRFATWYDLERDNDDFVAFVETMHDQAVKRRKRLAVIAGVAPLAESQAMDAAALAELAATIERADLSSMTRRQAIAAIMGEEAPKPIFREIYFSIAALRDAVMPERDITSDRWLFQHLTQFLDRRMLVFLRQSGAQEIAGSFSLNLNVATLLSKEFLDFDQWLRARSRASLVVELQKLDIFADLGAFVFARDFLRERGYRLCLDGISALALPFVDREQLGLDFLKLSWTPDMADPWPTERLTRFRDAVQRTGVSRIILAQCDNEEAVAFGRTLGLRLFQGRHIDRLLNYTASPALARRR